SYDAAGRVTARIDPTGARTTWSYEGDAAGPAGGSTTVVDPEKSVTVYQYANLELASVTEGAGTAQAATRRYTYSPAALVSSEADGNGHATRYRYDDHGNLTTIHDAR